ncbi:hypothetical protein, conserved [Babesia bigemina]|uniref:Uncharacterized protein n=1 Tax=Babesia bigemina TaxID=5866 RepID=A0A061DE92_BABBI|nr:hypothetical protein, conserved [Babesia bigemina]CDR98079.1 hypothetical protein, conserved [Babesia bigemina]|eukprot:XP_012770265.1 hypothetical protein, conserved [Babesia bigemina]
MSSAPAESSEVSDRKIVLIWQLKLSACLAGVVVSAYGAYVVISSGFQLDKCRRKFSLHWNGLLYGNSLPVRVSALLNSQYNVCLQPDVLRSLSTYFIKFDLTKENGFRRSDALMFLETVEIATDDPIVDRFIAAGVGESREHRMVSGCSLQEFAELLEALVLDSRMKGDDQLEIKIKQQLEEVNGEAASDAGQPLKEFRLNNPFLLNKAKSLSKELHKHMQEDFKVSEITDIQHELQRNYNFRDKLQRIGTSRKLTDAEVRRLENVNQEIYLLEEELSKQKHVCNLVSSK